MAVVRTSVVVHQVQEEARSQPNATVGSQRKNGDYIELRERLRRAGLLEIRLAPFVWRVIRTLTLLVLVVVGVRWLGDTWLQLVLAPLLAFAFTQLGLLGHDVGHRQAVRVGRWADWLSWGFGNVLIGVGQAWWVSKHNQHHSHSNEEGKDPDIDIPMLAFSDEDALTKRGLARYAVRYQHWLLFPLMTMLAIVWRPQSIMFAVRGGARHPVREVAGMGLHFVLLLALVFSTMSLPVGLAFLALNQALFGLYMGSIFAPNHKGMPLWPSDAPIDFLRQQVLTSRNVVGHPITDFWYGGLNYQIEHHLFPTLARDNLSKARPLVKAFCAETGLLYHETSIWRSYSEILGTMREIALVARAAAR